MSLIKSYLILQNAKVTAFTISELLSENQQGVKLPPTQIRVKKLEYRVLVESTKIENATFPYKNVLSKISVQTNRMRSTKWTYHSLVIIEICACATIKNALCPCDKFT